MISRFIDSSVRSHLYQGKAILIYGARQTGKTTLVKAILEQHSGVYFNADEPDVRLQFAHRSSSELKALIGPHKLVVLDEAQRIENIGLTLKLLVDNFPDMQVIATGSSSFELADHIKEPLTGRKYEYVLPPLSLEEIDYVEEQGNNLLAAEIKWRAGHSKIPSTFTNAYPSAKGIVVSRENWRALAHAAID